MQKKKMLAGTVPEKNSGSGSSADSNWGGVRETAKTEDLINAGPEPTINLDDKEFGKY